MLSMLIKGREGCRRQGFAYTGGVFLFGMMFGCQELNSCDDVAVTMSRYLRCLL